MHRLLIPLSLFGCPSPTPTPSVPTGEADTDTDTDTDADADTDVDTDTDTEVPTRIYPPTPEQLSTEAVVDIHDELEELLEDAVGTTGMLVVDADNGQVVYSRLPDQPFKPASNTKLFTTSTAFTQLGEMYQPTVAVYAEGSDTTDLTVVGMHDSSWSTDFYADPGLPAARLAAAIAEAGVVSVDTLLVQGELLVDGNSLGTYLPSAHRSRAADDLVDALDALGIPVTTHATHEGFPADFVEPPIAVRQAPPLSVLAVPINSSSHNEAADLLARQLGFELGAGSDYPSFADVVTHTVDGWGLDTTTLALNDGSGLSHDNRVSPRMVVELQRHMLSHPSGDAWRATLSITGHRGTLRNRMTNGDLRGRFLGKSGTLNGVIATSGQLLHVHDGHTYLVSILSNQVADWTLTRGLHDRLIRVVARDRRAPDPRPATPRVRAFVHGDHGSATLHWDPVDDALGYAVELSSDGRVWTERIEVEHPPLELTGRAEGPLFARVVATRNARRSDPSTVFATRVGAAVPGIALIDGNRRWDDQPENPTSRGHTFLVDLADALGSRAFDSFDAETFTGPDAAAYGVLVWHLGEESTTGDTFDADEQSLVADYLDHGGKLFVSGAEIGWDLAAVGSHTDELFLAERLGALFVEDDAETYDVLPVEGGLLDGLPPLRFYTPGGIDAAFPDVIDPATGSTSILRYRDGIGGSAAISTSDVVVFGFPFCTLDHPDDRAAVMNRVMLHFGM